MKEELIYKVLSGQANEMERKDLERWIESDPENAEEFEDIKSLYQADQDFDKGAVEHDDRFYDGLRNVLLRIELLRYHTQRRKLYQTAGIAVLIFSFIAAAFLFSNSFSSQDKSQPVSQVRIVDNLVFHETTLKTVFSTLESKYDLVIKVNDRDMLSCKFTGTFYRGTSIDDVLHALARSENFDISVGDRGTTFELYGKGCSI